MNCPHCHSDIPTGQATCPNCGAPTPPQAASNEASTPSIASGVPAFTAPQVPTNLAYPAPTQEPVEAAKQTPEPAVEPATSVPTESFAAPVASAPATPPMTPPTPVESHVPDSHDKQPKKKSKKLLFAIIGGVLALVLIVIGIFAVMEIRQANEYDQATSMLSQQSYADAKEKFESLGSYRDSSEKAMLCQQHLDYELALSHMSDGEYETAQQEFKDLVPFEDSADMVAECQRYIEYNSAEGLAVEMNYAEAEGIFRSLAADSFLDSEERANECAYALAEGFLAAGENYKAYKAFLGLGGFGDSADRALGCVIPNPASGEIYRNGDFGATDSPIVISSKDVSNPYYVKIYSGETVVSTIFLNPNSSVTVSLPVGSYTLKAASGKQWFGETDLFGDDGYYYVMVFGGDAGDTMVIEPNYEYTLDLEVAEGGNVDSRNSGRSAF